MWLRYFFLNIVAFALALTVTWSRNTNHESLVSDVNDRNFDDFIAQQPVLLEFYAPWCAHCRNFERHYEQIADRLKHKGFAVGKVDVTKNPALTSRFEVEAMPTFFLCKNGKVWQIEINNMSPDAMIDFSLHGYKDKSPMPFWTSPLGIVGNAKGLIFRVSTLATDSFTAWCDRNGIPMLVGFMMLAFCGALLLLGVTFVGIIISLNHIKND